MTPRLPPRAVVGQQALAALGVPARFAILSHLLDAGPRTASECADVVGESPSNCSWHLRALAKVGLVERVSDGDGAGNADGRRRLWQAAAVGFDFSPGTDGRPEAGDSPAGRVAAAAVEANSAQYSDALLRRYMAARPALPSEWTDVAGGNGYSLLLTPAELDSLLATLDAIIRPYVRPIRTAPPPGAAIVHMSTRAFLNPDLTDRDTSGGDA